MVAYMYYFGNPAIVAYALDPRLCVLAFRQVYLFYSFVISLWVPACITRVFQPIFIFYQILDKFQVKSTEITISKPPHTMLDTFLRKKIIF
jgi:hypothetical protein